MIIKTRTGNTWMRGTALGLATALTLPTLAGCGSSQTNTPPPPTFAPNGGNLPPGVGAPQARRSGMSTKQKMVLLAGAAALYYLYKRKQNAQGQSVQYYRSRNGRIYYRDPQTHQAIYVTPDSIAPIQVPANQAEDFRSYRGYNNSPNGRDLTNEIPVG